MSSKWFLILLGSLGFAALSWSQDLGMDRFVCKGLRSCQTFSWDYRGRAERSSAGREKLWDGSRGMGDPGLSADKIRDRIGEQAIHRGCNPAAGGQRQVECRGSSQQVLPGKPFELEGCDYSSPADAHLGAP